jgi:hypothetical protein
MGAKFNRKDFLDALFFTYCRDKGGFIMVKISDRYMAKTTTRYFPTTDSLAREQYGDDQNVLFGTCPRDKMKPGREYVQHMTVVWAGLDIGPDGYSGKEKHFTNDKQAIMAIKSFPIEPSIVVQSGRGFHLYWLLKEFKEVTKPHPVEEVLRQVNEFFQCSSRVSLDAVLRLPETWNPKHPAHPLPCRLHHMNTSARYDFTEFENLDLRVIIPSKPSPRIAQPLPPPPVTRSRVTLIQESAELPESVLGPQDVETAPQYLPDEHESTTDSTPVGEMVLSGGSVPEKISPRASGQAEKLVEQFLDGFSERLLDKLADRIVDRLIQKLPSGGKR